MEQVAGGLLAIQSKFKKSPSALRASQKASTTLRVHPI